MRVLPLLVPLAEFPSTLSQASILLAWGCQAGSRDDAVMSLLTCANRRQQF